MFRLTFRPIENRDIARVEYFNDIKDLGNTILGITSNEREANYAINWASNTTFGKKVIRYDFNYKIECFNEEEVKVGVEQAVKEICNHFRLDYKYIGIRNNNFTFNIGNNTGVITFNDAFGYSIKLYRQTNKGNEVAYTATWRSKDTFITDTIVNVERLMQQQMEQSGTKYTPAKTYTKISRADAMKRYNKFMSIYLLPSKLSPDNPWMPPCEIKRSDKINDFEKVINEFKFYNCTKETGLSVHYYI